MAGLLQRIAKRRAKVLDKATYHAKATRPVVKRRKGNGGAEEFVRGLFAPGNAYDGALSVIAKAKENGTWFDPDAKKEAKKRFKLNRKVIKARVAKLEARLGLNGDDKKTKRPRITRSKGGGEGYKGHRPGSRAEQAHRLVDEGGKADKVIASIAKLGIKESTARAWYKQWSQQ